MSRTAGPTCRIWVHRYNTTVRVIIEHRLYDFPDCVRERRGQVNGYLMSDSYAERYLWTHHDLKHMKMCIEFQVNHMQPNYTREVPLERYDVPLTTVSEAPAARPSDALDS